MNAPSPTDTDRRTAILDAAVESFGKLGYYGTSLQRIATEVGLTKAGVLHYVGSKEGLLKLALTGKTFQLPVAVDIEDKLQVALSKSALTDIVAHCLSVVESWGVYAMLYTGLNFGQTNLYMGGAALKPYDVWLAAYRTKKPAPGWPFGMWQYTSSGKIPGIAKGADLSVAYKDYAGIIQRAGLTKVRGA